MKTLKKLFTSSLLLTFLAIFAGCEKNDVPQGPQPTGTSKQFKLFAVSNPSINGTVTFTKRSDNATIVTIQLAGTSSTASHPAHIHANSAAEGGAIVLDLATVNGSTGKSETVVTTLNSGAAVTYEQLIAFDGYVNVHLSSANLATLVAQGDIGPNELTTINKVYTLDTVSNPAIRGTATFTKRVSGKTLVSLALTGTTAGVTSIAHIHINTVAETGAVVVDLTSVNGPTGKSETTIKKLNSGAEISYDELLNFNGYINVHESATMISTLIAQGDIGKNQLTTTSFTYPLASVSNPAISGSAKFTKRVSGETLVSIVLTGTTAGEIHPAHIHNNSVAQTGSIAIDLTNVNGATGKSETSVRTLNNGSAISYDQLIAFNGYINVHQSTTNLATIIAQGNIGSNVGGGGTPTINYNVTNAGSSSYIFNGGGFTNVNNPTLTLQRGRTYTFSLNVPGHPFYIKTTQTTGTGNPFNTGVTNNGASSGTVTFVVPASAPNTLYYICEFHTPMTGVINVTN